MSKLRLAFMKKKEAAFLLTYKYDNVSKNSNCYLRLDKVDVKTFKKLTQLLTETLLYRILKTE